MNTESSALSIHLPLALLSLGIAALLAAQIGAGKKSVELMQWQIETGQKNIEEMQALEKQYADAITTRETMVKQSGELQGQLQALLTDLLELAKTDTEAEQIIKKWNVQQNATPAAGGAKGEAEATP